MDFIFIGAMALFYLLTVALTAGCNKLGKLGEQP